VRPVRAADHSPPSSAAVMEEYCYTSTHPLGHTGPVTGSLYILPFIKVNKLTLYYLNTHIFFLFCIIYFLFKYIYWVVTLLYAVGLKQITPKYIYFSVC